MNQVITLSQFIANEQLKYPGSTGDLSKLFRDIKLAAKIVNRDVRKAGLVDILGEHGTINVQGEKVKKLDVLANDIFIASLKAGRDCCAVLSEEEDFFHEVNRNAKYVVAMDPLDGSSNIDVNATIGTIFSIYKRLSSVGSPVTEEDCLQPGVNQVAAGYVIYGSSTMLVYTTGQGVNGFTLDGSIGDFCLSHPDIRIPVDGAIYSVNEGNFSKFSDGVKAYIEYCKASDSATGRPYSARYIGSLVADFHRNLLKGGIFMYPGTSSAPKGKLRLMYECNPMSFLIEQAGGRSVTGEQRIMEVIPTELHQRVPVFMGSKNMVEQLEQMLNATTVA
ncbi:MAG: class 1 fructose-bisphosphatase [Flavobacteriales bacterium]|nr:class 1 fructose-bisphosphatase [Flavobacteriales bacterium]